MSTLATIPNSWHDGQHVVTVDGHTGRLIASYGLAGQVWLHIEDDTGRRWVGPLPENTTITAAPRGGRSASKDTA